MDVYETLELGFAASAQALKKLVGNIEPWFLAFRVFLACTSASCGDWPITTRNVSFFRSVSGYFDSLWGGVRSSFAKDFEGVFVS